LPLRSLDCPSKVCRFRGNRTLLRDEDFRIASYQSFEFGSQ
jgi:hypothetical protein